MQVIFIAVQDAVCRKQMAEVFIDVGHNIIVTNSTADALGRIPKNSAG
jgi:prefoldin subunit 5